MKKITFPLFTYIRNGIADDDDPTVFSIRWHQIHIHNGFFLLLDFVRCHVFHSVLNHNINLSKSFKIKKNFIVRFKNSTLFLFFFSKYHREKISIFKESVFDYL